MSEPIPLQSFLQGSGSNLTDTVRRAGEDGEYETVSEVIREALQLWEARRQPRQRDLDVLRQNGMRVRQAGEPGHSTSGVTLPKNAPRIEVLLFRLKQGLFVVIPALIALLSGQFGGAKRMALSRLVFELTTGGWDMKAALRQITLIRHPCGPVH